MAQIQVTPELLRNKADEVVHIKNNHDNIINNISKLVHNLNTQWKGAAQTAFLNKYDSMQSTFVNFSQMLQGYSDLMKTAAQQLEAQDESLQGTMNSFN